MPSATARKGSEQQSQEQPQTSSSPTGKKKPGAKKDDKPAGADIRNFFGGPGPSSTSSRSTPKTTKPGTGAQPIAVLSSDEEAPETNTLAVKTTSKHFVKPAVQSRSEVILSDSNSPSPASTSRHKASSSTTTSKMPSKRPLIDSDLSEDEMPAAKRQTVSARSQSAATKRSGSGRKRYMDLDESDGEEDLIAKLNRSTKTGASRAGNGKSKAKQKDAEMELHESSDDGIGFVEEDEKARKSSRKAPATKGSAAKQSASVKSAPSTAAAKKEDMDKEKEEEEKQDEAAAKKKANYLAFKARSDAGPKAPGSKVIPEGAPGCLEGLTFVFTGELESLGRDDANELAKRYGGRVTGAPSKKTSYVVIGENAGASKIAKLKDEKLKDVKHLDEDGFLALIEERSRGGAGAGQLSETQIKAKEKEEKKVRDQVKEMEKQEKEEAALQKRKQDALSKTGIATKKSIPTTAQLWTTKYAPTNIKDICGNKGLVEKLSKWLQTWESSYKSGFKKPGPDGMNIYRAVLISGSPGIGKTTSAHLVAKMAGYNPIELNASDARSKKLVENGTNIDNTSLDGFFSGQGIQSTTVADVRVDHKTCLIMDEVDGMSAGDRGGVGALNMLIKKTRIPMILICNDRTLQKMKPLQSTTYNMSFRKPQPNEIRSRIMSIAFKEGLKIPGNVLDELIRGANSDIRQVLNMMSTFRLGAKDMNFDEGKDLMNEKNMIMTPFTIIDKLTNPYAFSRTNKDSLNAKSDLYFHDISFVPLFMQEHYLKTNPAPLNKYDDREKPLKNLELISKAADWISDGDLVDRMIRGGEQQWSLLPMHAIASTVAPAFFTYGGMRTSGGGGYGSWGPAFPQWLGQNSKQTKLQRLLTDIQIRMRLRVSGGKHEIREQYMPMLASKIVSPLKDDGQDALDGVIGTMDEYYLGKDDWDAFVELGVGEMNQDAVLKKIPTAIKSAFTRQYNKSDHPIAFHKGDMFAASKKKIADQGPAPDNEDVEDEVAASDDDGKDDTEEVNDVTKDKLVKEVKPKGAKGKAAAAKAAPKKGKK